MTLKDFLKKVDIEKRWQSYRVEQFRNRYKRMWYKATT